MSKSAGQHRAGRLQLLAADHLVLCNKCGGMGLHEISTITRYLMASWGCQRRVEKRAIA